MRALAQAPSVVARDDVRFAVRADAVAVSALWPCPTRFNLTARLLALGAARPSSEEQIITWPALGAKEPRAAGSTRHFTGACRRATGGRSRGGPTRRQNRGSVCLACRRAPQPVGAI